MNLARSRPKPASGKTSRAVAARLSQTRLGEVQGRKRSDTGRSPGAAPEQGRAAGAGIEKLESAHPELKAKGREANRTVKAANRRIAELEARVNLLHTKGPEGNNRIGFGREPESIQRLTGTHQAFDC